MTVQVTRRYSSFLLYASVGVVNTLIHWSVFLALVGLAEMAQGPANTIAFACAVTVSFLANARITFKRSATLPRYASYVLFLGLVSYMVGWAGEAVVLPPLVTAVSFSAISLVIGYLYSRFVIFAEPRP